MILVVLPVTLNLPMYLIRSVVILTLTPLHRELTKYVVML